jgi:thiamine biosynthesis lipoprotein
LQGGALATSGDHWHVFTQGGRRYSHTIDRAPASRWRMR